MILLKRGMYTSFTQLCFNMCTLTTTLLYVGPLTVALHSYNTPLFVFQLQQKCGQVS